MSQLVCAITGKISTEPVISTKTGYIYDRKLIEKLLEKDKVCPITNLPLVKEELQEVKISTFVPAMNPNETSLSGLVGSLSNNFNELIKEVSSNKKKLEIAEQELSQHLYQHDASCRVISKLIEEIKMLKDQLVSDKYDYLNNNNEYDEDDYFIKEEEYDNMGINSYIIEKINEKSIELSTNRKGKFSKKTAVKDEVI